ncbi:hypothetical protein BCU26_016720 [Vibrio splendidus]|jgi:response regulator RpfG family c-di-GMP phosphodiesterase|uniref:hypothetical protein n=1 Tax=Vibrio TaxID=662 RepID=UPI000C83DB90|nr:MULTISPECIES: hypothetical protein [Vibrio]PMH68770.1 hypothetical protein BCU61_16915 [Vibrio splendidus]PMJ31768.1 hypothetical protein BCU26_02235 [Vibrio splendidus]PMN22119.1 hypothetical protein BCT37_12465 [Vibrio cyclitrophicus]
MKENQRKYNQAHYANNSEILKEKARARRAAIKQQKTFSDLLKEFADNVQLAEANYLQSVVTETGIDVYRLAEVYKQLRAKMRLTDHQRLHIANNAPVKKLLRQRLNQTREVKELL